MTFHFFLWFSHTWLSLYMQKVTWGFAMVEVVHLLALTILGGVVLIVNLRLLGLGLKRQPVAVVSRSLHPLLLMSLIAIVLSGALLVATDPMKYYENIAFWIKIRLLVAAIMLHAGLQLWATNARNQSDRVPLWAKSTAMLSLLLWLGIGIAGRAIGLI
jgi:hypothetical protein